MVDKTLSPAQVESSWDTYWHGVDDAGAYTSGGISHPALIGFWDAFFRRIREMRGRTSLLDLASGNGAVIDQATEIFEEGELDITAVDVSESAVASIKKRLPQVRGLVMDARSMALEDASYDVVTSQFGIEYAGVGAVLDAVRLVRPGGIVAFILHNKDSSIFSKCADSRTAVGRVLECGFIPLATEMFRAGFAAVRGASRESYDNAAVRLAPAIAVLDSIMEEYGSGIADDTIARLYGDVADIHTRIQHYDPDEVLGWLERMLVELESYTDRMSSMCESAFDEEMLEGVCARLRERGFTIDTAGPLLGSDSATPLAWALIAGRSAE